MRLYFLHQFLGLGPRDEHAWRHPKRAAAEVGLPQDILDGLVSEQAKYKFFRLGLLLSR